MQPCFVRPHLIILVGGEQRSVTKAVKSELEKVLKLIVDSAEKRLSHLPPGEAAAARKKIRQIAAATASQGREKGSKSARTGASRVSPRSRV